MLQIGDTIGAQRRLEAGGKTSEYLRRQAVELATICPRSEVIKVLKINGSMLRSLESRSRPGNHIGKKFFEMKAVFPKEKHGPARLSSTKQRVRLALTVQNVSKLEFEGYFHLSDITKLSKSFLGGRL